MVDDRDVGGEAAAAARRDAVGVDSWASHVDDATLRQAEQTARLACVHGHVKLMPDAHVGKGTTVGSVIPTVEAIIPSAVGVDIGCGVVGVRTRFAADDLPDDLGGVVDEFARRVPAGVGVDHETVRDRAWRRFVDRHGEPDGDERLRRKAPLQFGTLGSGNHFLEVCVDEADRVWLMLHSGSRGAGNVLAQRHIAAAERLAQATGQVLEDRAHAWLPEGSDEFAAYVADLEWAQAYAWGNREQIAEIALDVLARTCAPAGRQPPGRGHLVELEVNNHHNYAAREEHGGVALWVTRKGAIRAQHGELGVVPGSMGTGSFVVRGLGNPASLQSAAHGAGRAMSRGEARRRFSGAQLAEAMAGIAWLEHARDALVDEAPMAYKDLDTVMADQADLVEVVHRLETVANYKGT